MIFEHRTYYILQGKMPEFNEAFSTMVVPLFEKYGAKFVGAWQTTIGPSNEFVYILGFENLATQEKFWQEIRKDAQLQKYAQGGPRYSHVVNRILTPVPYSPIK